MATLVDIKDLTVTYDGDKVLDNVSLSIEEGEMIGIIGRSGSGKTVLLNVLRGLDESIPATGQIVYHGAACDWCGRVEPPGKAGGSCPKCGGPLSPISEDILNGADPVKKRNISRRVAIMIQRTFGIYGDDSVIENVMKALDDSGYGGDRIMRAADIIDQVKLSHRMMHIARDLSGGEKQRVVMARQLAREPMMLLADEPTGTLDPKTAQVVHQNLKKLSKELGITVLITSHFPGVIEEMATRALLLENGRIKMLGRPEDVIKAFTGGIEAVERKEVQAGGSVIKVEGLYKKYFSVDRGVINAVNGVSFDIREGEIFGIVGTSGAGKTSLTNILTGNLEPTSGMVEMKVGDDWINLCEPGYYARGRAKPYIGLLHQEYDLYPHRTVIENMTDSIGLEFPAELAQKKAIHTLQISGFDEKRSRDILGKYPGELSEGERHRVALAQVLIKEPHVIFLDEPTGTMDPITKKYVINSILSARQDIGETFVIVSHDMDFVRTICDRAAYVKGGKIVSMGKPEEVLPLIQEIMK
ncbi:putative methylcoenzyme M reductase system component A2 [Methanocella paludicola SANAE]|uniref:Methylcoenzyme M reductase system component A2 n=1 Tax=Methanocella paludicola (strain DSM 17711 / JCM 13418 / NBRC 101707 / SANAE) TaxID=304371 RepID=D1YVX2_METPS|nr:methyl coenzyme M reductase system, component A2 [Methanocella paludicola]BAI60594.1 putative methylcoenzyme M reductase system component A2 [Methanocella paludicola SANAE]